MSSRTERMLLLLAVLNIAFTAALAVNWQLLPAVLTLVAAAGFTNSYIAVHRARVRHEHGGEGLPCDNE